MCVRVYICMCVCESVYMYVCVCACERVEKLSMLANDRCVYIYVYICVYICAFVCGKEQIDCR